MHRIYYTSAILYIAVYTLWIIHCRLYIAYTNPELKSLIKQNVIVPVEVPTNWCSPIVCVPKADCDLGIRLCIDFTELNKNVERAVFPVPKIDVTLARLKHEIFYKIRC